jgi:gluconate 2-dehydrogenase alpha chain
MARKLPAKDVAIIGLGWTGSILAHELAEEGLDVIAIERGPWRDTATDFPPAYAPDELRYRVRHDLFLRPAQTTLTFRNNNDQTALPVREWGAFMLGNGAGGAGIHWNAETWRFLPSDFTLKSHLTQRYGANFIPADATIQDWGVSYDELEPYYDRFEYLCGTSGTAGNLKGQIQHGGNPFEGPRSRPYPTPAQKQPFSHALFAKAAGELGYKPFPQPSGNLSQAYTNPLGVELGPCTYCGFCEWFGCGNYSKASPQTTILPALLRKPNFTARTECEVTKINLDGSGKHATGVTFVDSFRRGLGAACRAGDPLRLPAMERAAADAVGDRPDLRPEHRRGSDRPQFLAPNDLDRTRPFRQGPIRLQPLRLVGRDRHVEFNGDNFNHGPHGFIGGGYMGQVQTNGRPIDSLKGLPAGTPAWGAKWKQAMRDNYLSTGYAGTGVHGSCQSYRQNHIDLDPTYKDRFGRPLIRMTMDFPENEIKMSAFDRPLRRDHQGDGRAYGREAAAQRALRRDAIPDLASLRRRDHGHQPERKRA